MSGDVRRSPRRLFLAADETTVVAETDSRAAFLLVAPGQPIPAGYEIPDELLEPLPEEPAPIIVGDQGPEVVFVPAATEVHTVSIGTPTTKDTGGEQAPTEDTEKVAPDAAAAAEKATPKPKAKPKPKAPADTTTPATPEE